MGLALNFNEKVFFISCRDDFDVAGISAEDAKTILPEILAEDVNVYLNACLNCWKMLLKTGAAAVVIS